MTRSIHNIAIRKSRGGRFIIGDRSAHYHALFANVLLKRHVARSGNMFRRGSFAHFLNTKLASYAVPSFRNTGDGRDRLQADDTCLSGMVRELDRATPVSLYMSLSNLACVQGVRYVLDGKFYRMKVPGGRPVLDMTMPTGEYPMGIYYGWFTIRRWTVAKSGSKRSGYVTEMRVLGCLLQKRSGKALCGRIVWHDKTNGRKRTDNSYSRENLFPAETAIQGGESKGKWKRCASRKFVPSSSCVYIPFEDYDALPYLNAFVPVNYSNPVSPGITLKSEFSSEYDVRTKMIYQGALPTSSSSVTISLGETDPSTILFSVSVAVPMSDSEAERLGCVTVGNMEYSLGVWLNGHLDASRYQFLVADFVTYVQATMRQTVTWALGEVTKAFGTETVFYKSLVSCIESYRKALEAQGGADQDSSNVYDASSRYSSTQTTTSPLYENGEMVRSKVVKTSRTQDYSLRVSYTADSVTKKVYRYDKMTGTVVETERSVAAKMPTVSTLMLGGHVISTELGLSSPVIETDIVGTALSGSSIVIKHADIFSSTGTDTSLMSAPFLVKLYTYDFDGKHARVLRGQFNDPSGDLDLMAFHGMALYLTLPNSLRVSYDGKGVPGDGFDDNRFVVFLNASGTPTWAEYASVWSECAREVYSQVHPSHEVLYDSRLEGMRVLMPHIMERIQGKTVRMSDAVRAEVLYRVSNRQIPYDNVEALRPYYILVKGFHKGVFDMFSADPYRNDGYTHRIKPRSLRMYDTYGGTISAWNDEMSEAVAVQWITELLDPVVSGIIDLHTLPMILFRDATALQDTRPVITAVLHYGAYPLCSEIGRL